MILYSDLRNSQRQVNNFFVKKPISRFNPNKKPFNLLESFIFYLRNNKIEAVSLHFCLILCYFTVHTSVRAKNDGVSNLCLKKVV